MSPVEIGLTAIAIILALSLFGVPIGAAMVLTAAGGMLVTVGDRFMWSTLQSLPYEFATQYTFVVVPMFVLMGVVAAKANIIQELYNSAIKWIGGMRGGLYGATVFASAGFSAISGSTIVNSSVFGKVALPEMLRHGYYKGFSAASIAAAGTLAGLIPPSLSFVVFGILTGESIGRLLMAGVIPGMITAAAYIGVIAVVVRWRPSLAPRSMPRFTLREKIASLGAIWPIVVLAVLVIGGIYLGFMPPSAAGAVGAVGAILLAFARRSISRSELADSFHETMIITGTLFFVVIGGLLLGRFFVVSGFIRDMTDLITALDISIVQFVAIVIALYLVMGMFIDPLSMIVVTLPVLYPLSQELGMDGIWFAVIIVKMVEISAITPPVGLNLFAVMAASETRISASEIYLGVLPFVAAEAVVLALLFSFPSLSTWLPMQMIG
jgi:C4-dicarboxylate transporter, DctM subunit